jgi:hypothetical protein
MQYADIYQGQRIVIPRDASGGYRQSENLLRIVVDNAVAHHTTMPLRYFADSLPDREAKDKALIDTLWMNHVAHQQDLNGLFRDAMYSAMPAGFCPVHVWWRSDQQDQYEAVGPAATDSPERQLMQMIDPKPGMIDCWLGNPLDTVFDVGAKRSSAHWCSYGRVLPAKLVRNAFGHLPGVAGLEGTRRIPSAAQYQRLIRGWQGDGLSMHGSPAISERRGENDDEELMILVCREVLPGIDVDWPMGRLQIIAVPGAVDLMRGEGADHAVLLADQDLPGGDYSWTNFYSHHRGDDIYGKPWVEDLDEYQVRLNLAISKHYAYTEKMRQSPMVVPGGVVEDMAEYDGYNVLEVEISHTGFRPQVIKQQPEVLAALERQADMCRRALYTVGGYQAASRGESLGSRTAAKTVMALQNADSSIHSTVNQRFRRSACDFAVKCWKQFKMYGDIPSLIEAAGDEYGYLVEPYVDNTKLSDRPPKYRLVNAFGPTPEAVSQEILQLVQMRGADGRPLLTTERAKRLYPNREVIEDDDDAKAVARQRAKIIAKAAIHLAAQVRANGMQETDPGHPWVKEAAQQVAIALERKFPRLRDDDLPAHLAAYSAVIQDETADIVARYGLMRRQDAYFQWQAERAQQQRQAMGQLPGQQTTQPQQPNDDGRRAVAQEMATGGGSQAVLA